MTRHDKEIIDLNTKVTAMFTPLEDIFAYRNMMIQVDDLNLTDTLAVTHSNRAMV